MNPSIRSRLACSSSIGFKRLGIKIGQRAFILPLVVMAFCIPSSAQVSLYVPNGSSGVLTSTNNNIGIGTNSPIGILDVRGESSYFGQGPGHVYFKHDTLNFRNDVDGQSAGYINYYGYAGGITQYRDLGVYNGRTGLIAHFQGSTGNVGIGTTSPQAKLQVGGWNLIKDGTWAPPAFPTSTSAGERIVFYEGGGWKTAIGMDNQNGIWFQSHTPGEAVAYQWFTGGISATPTEKMRVMANGNVGIGTTAPTHKLAVNGTIRAQEIIVDTGWADYVFADDYRLAPLSEVKTHIQEHRHLPGIPSASSVAVEGISLGEFQTKLLAKIEELTLHTIRQQEMIEAQNAEIASLRSIILPQSITKVEQ